MNTNNNEIPEEVIELLPWFAIGGLSLIEHKYFQEALSEYPELQLLVEQEREITSMVSEDKTLLDLSVLEPTEERLKRVFNQIDSPPISSRVTEQETSSLTDKVKQALTSWLPSTFAIPQYTRFASVTVLIISLAILTAFIAPLFTQKNEFIPASAINSEVNNSASTTILLVGFNGTSMDLSSNNVFKDKLKKIESVPGKEGMYRVSLNQKLNSVQIAKIIAALTAQKQSIWFVGEAF